VAFPTRGETETWLAMLATGEVTPEAASDWARPFLTDDSTHPVQMDKTVWAAIKALGGADLRGSPDEYLYGESDYQRWLTELRQATDK